MLIFFSFKPEDAKPVVEAAAQSESRAAVNVVPGKDEPRSQLFAIRQELHKKEQKLVFYEDQTKELVKDIQVRQHYCFVLKMSFQSGFDAEQRAHHTALPLARASWSIASSRRQ